METIQTRLLGAGGQGASVAGFALAKSALLSGYYATFKGTNTSQMIGGPTMAEVLMNEDKEPSYPRTIKGEVDFMLCTSDNSFQVYKDGMKPGGLAVIDPNLVFPNDDDRLAFRIIEIPIIEIAENEVGMLKSQSAIDLAIAVKILTLMMGVKIGEDVAFDVLIKRVSGKTRDVNKRAFDLGLKYAEEEYNKLLAKEVKK